MLMHYTQSPSFKAQYHQREVDVSDSRDPPASSDRVHWLRPETTYRSRLKNASHRPSAARRTVRAFARYFFAVLVGVAATLGWQSYGDDAMEMVRARDPWLSWLLPAPVAKPPSPVTAAEVQQQLKPMAFDIALIRRSVEQFAANLDQLGRKEEQMAQNIATMQATEQQLIQKVSSPPPSRPAHVTPPSAPQPAQ
jgi:hypothetical protein